MGVWGLHVALALHVRRFSGFVVFEFVFFGKSHGKISNHIQDWFCDCDEPGVGSMDYDNQQIHHMDIIEVRLHNAQGFKVLYPFPQILFPHV